MDFKRWFNRYTHRTGLQIALVLPVLLLGSSLSIVGFAVTQTKQRNDNKSQAQAKTTTVRVGGNYKVKKIERLKDSSFLVIFESTETTGRADVIRLESDHIHMGVSEGQVLRISAEVTADKGKVVEAQQVLLFLPQIEGPMPVWMLSRHSRSESDLNGASYLEMHAPQSDFLIF